jgi:signal peptidase I
MKDLYGVLGVGRDATSDEITDAYWRHVRFHSEAAVPLTDESRSQISEVRRAYEILSDPERRAAYDAGDHNAAVAPARPAPAAEPKPAGETKRTRNPLDRLTAGLPRPWRIAIDWVVTIAGAIAIVLLIKAYVVNPYRIPSSSMEPTLHCAHSRPGDGCEAHYSDRVLANRFIYHFRDPARGDIVVFNTPALTRRLCNAGGTFVKRIIALPGETWSEKNGYVYINGKKLNEPYIKPDRRDSQTNPPQKIPKNSYFVMGDNRMQSCDSRVWGVVPRGNLIGPVFFIYWPPNRIGFP